MGPIPVRRADSKGRVAVGAEHAHKQFFISHRDDSVIQLIPAETVLAREAWLFKDPEALASVMKGLEQARSGQLSDGPDIDEALAFAETIGDD